MSGIRLTFVTDEFSSLNPGVSSALADLVGEMSRSGEMFSSITLVSTGMDDFGRVPAGVKHIDCPYPTDSALRRAWRWPRNFRSTLEEIVKESDIVHIHGIWLSAQYFAAKLCIKHRKPFILTAHGILSPWLWRYQGVKGYLKKIIYWKALVYPLLKEAAAIHAITPMEEAYLRALFPDVRMCVIPNAIDPEAGSAGAHLEDDPEPIVLFVGRLHPVKGADMLVRAFGDAALAPSWRLVIAGPTEDAGYAAELKALVLSQGLDDRVDFVGPVYGHEKHALYRRAWVLAMPSHSEVIGMVNLEASSYRTPTITTPQTGLSNWEEGGGLLVDPNPGSLGNALREAASWGTDERRTRGEKSRDLIRNYYSWEKVGRRWRDLYAELSGSTSDKGASVS